MADTAPERSLPTLDFDALRPPSPFFTLAHEEWRAALRRFVDREIMPHVEAWEEAGRLPDELYLKAGAFGLLGAGWPQAHGGTGEEGWDGFHGIVTAEELARPGAGGIAAALMVHGIGLPPVMRMGSDALKALVAPDVLAGRARISLGITEPDAGSDVRNLATRAQRRGDVWVVNGAKLYITGGMTSRWLTTAVRTGGPGIGGISLLLMDLEAPGVTRAPLRKQGWWSSLTPPRSGSRTSRCQPTA
jgi:acyl-CoA dehydrogenase